MPKPINLKKHLAFLERLFNDDPPKGAQEEQRRKQIAALQQKQEIIFSDEFLEIPVSDAKAALQTTRPGQPPTRQHAAISLPADKVAPNPRSKDTATIRTFSKFRLVHGPVAFHSDDDPSKDETYDVISTCAPNLMDSSQGDETRFTRNEGGREQRMVGRENKTVEVLELNEDEYRKACEAQANFIVGAAKQKGNGAVIMPGFGVGVYIKRLSSASQEKAREIMIAAFSKASAEHKMPIEWVAYDNKTYDKMLKAQAKTPVPGSQLTVRQGDMFDVLKESKHSKPVLLNPGSDRTIGGNFTAENPNTAEEQIAQRTDII